jgi:flavin-dependent dehydrogenase
MRLDRAGGERWLAVGDAALSFDPLSSKGIGNALYTGILAAQSIVHADQMGQTDCPNYLQQVTRIFAVYQQQLQQFYQLETRWSDSVFWQRRQAQRAA